MNKVKSIFLILTGKMRCFLKRKIFKRNIVNIPDMNYICSGLDIIKECGNQISFNLGEKRFSFLLNQEFNNGLLNPSSQYNPLFFFKGKTGSFLIYCNNESKTIIVIQLENEMKYWKIPISYYVLNIKGFSNGLIIKGCTNELQLLTFKSSIHTFYIPLSNPNQLIKISRVSNNLT